MNLYVRMRLLILPCIFLFITLFTSETSFADVNNGMGDKVMEGGQRDFQWPVPSYHNISSCFLDPEAITVTHERDKYHKAIDIATVNPVNVVASYGGRVVYADWTTGGFGYSIGIEHQYRLSNGQTTTLYTRYSHLSSISVAAGNVVAKGAVIGKTGGTGGNYAVHLDFQILQNSWNGWPNSSIDPYANNLLELPADV